MVLRNLGRDSPSGSNIQDSGFDTERIHIALRLESAISPAAGGGQNFNASLVRNGH
jgi:hypothetical protein